ncbi:MAG TPA: conjugal transfer protein, partial [Clostridiales bacterium]|nr:conjugal transfer protein [Clostridiales bacterium]
MKIYIERKPKEPKQKKPRKPKKQKVMSVGTHKRTVVTLW